MRFLVDASCDYAVVRALRGAGHDVRSVHEERPTAEDREVATWASTDDRILVAEDRDFGHLVHVSAVPSVGIVYLRFPASARATMVAQACAAVARLGDRLRGAFVVVQPGKVRVTRGARPPWPPPP